jgi:hypothetical protein
MVCIRSRTRGAIWSRSSASAVSDDFAHRRLGGLDHGLGRVLAFEQPGARIVEAVLHGELDLDDVLVLCQHGRLAQARALDDGVAPHIGRADLRHEDQLMALDGVRQAPVDACAHGALVLAELGDDGLLAFLHDEDARAHPDDEGDARDQAHAHARAAHVGRLAAASIADGGLATAAARLAAEQAGQLAVQVAPQFVQIGRLATTARRRTVVAAVTVVACGFRRRRRRGTVRVGARGIVVLVVATSPARIIQVEHPAKALRQHRPAMGAL